jgi:hypothetical protein
MNQMHQQRILHFDVTAPKDTVHDALLRRGALLLLVGWTGWASLWGFDLHLGYLVPYIGVWGIGCLIVVLLLCAHHLERRPRPVAYVLIAVGSVMVALIPDESNPDGFPAVTFAIEGWEYWPYKRDLSTVALGGPPLVAAGLLLKPWRSQSRAGRVGLVVLLTGFVALATDRILTVSGLI